MKDNLDPDKVWLFDGSNGEKVTISVESGRSNPRINVTGPNGYNEGWFEDSDKDGTISITIDLTESGEYQIHLDSSTPGWSGDGYEIRFYKGDTAPTWGVPDTAPASGISVDNSGGTNTGVTISNVNNRWNSNNSGTDVSIITSGAVTLKGMDINNSGTAGLFINNQYATIGTPGVTLTNINFYSNDGSAATILSKGPVVVKTSDVNGNWGFGFEVHNDATGVLSPITLTDVNVNGYWGKDVGVTSPGIFLRSNGAATLTNTSANGNGGNGVDLVTKGAVTFSNTSAGDNSGDGIHIAANGNITLSRVQASGNNNYGTLLDNCAYDSLLLKCLGTGSVTLTDAFFDRNSSAGLAVLSAGAITWKNGSASDNRGYGASLNNYSGIGKPVIVTNVYTSGNDGTGLEVKSKGVVTITDSEAGNNSLNYHDILHLSEAWGYWKDNLTNDQVWLFSGTAGEEVTIQVQSERFSPRIYVTDSEGNYIDGIDDLEDGNYDGKATLSIDLTLTDDYQIHLEFISGGGWNGDGYEIKFYKGTEPSWGDPDEAPVNGFNIDNHEGINTGVAISNTSTRWNNNNSGTDIYIQSSGAVTLKEMGINDSGTAGLFVDNHYATIGIPGVTLTNIYFYSNDGAAATIFSRGPVVVKTSDVNGNWGFGFYVQNDATGVLSPITFTDVTVNGYFGKDVGVTDPGIFLRSNGAVTLTNTSANGNGGKGIDLVTKGAVTFSNTSAGDNSGDGIDISTNGAVTINKIGAWNNNGMGVSVVTQGSVTLNFPTTGWNWFTNNGSDGLNISAGGKITMTKVMARDNGRRDEFWVPTSPANGIILKNTNALAPILLTDLTTYNNTLEGLNIVTPGAVTITTLQANNNNHYGLYIDQSKAPDSLKPILLSTITADNNGWNADSLDIWDGANVTAMGSITTNFFTFVGNSDAGAVLDNLAGGNAAVTILNTLGKNIAIANGQGEGIKLVTGGAVSVTDLEATYNGLNGLDIVNTNDTIKPAVTLSLIVSRFNQNGINVVSSGVITLNNSWSVSNHGDGINLYTLGNVYINNNVSLGNDRAGIRATTEATPAIAPKIIIVKSAYFGNLRDPDPGDKNLMKIGGWAMPWM